MKLWRVAVVGTALAFYVYAGTTTVDAWVGDLTRAMRMMNVASVILLDVPALIAIGLLFYGGLPLAIFGLLSDRQWAAGQQRRYLRVPYAVLMFQIVSVLFTGFLLVVTGLSLIWALAQGRVPHGWLLDPRDWFLPAYLSVQLLAGTAAIPAWRRHVTHTSVRRYKLITL